MPRDENLPHYVTACVVRASRPPEPRPVFEWLSYHWHMGVTKFRLYDAGVVDQRLATVVSEFLSNGTLDVVPTRHLALFHMAFDSHVSGGWCQGRGAGLCIWLAQPECGWFQSSRMPVVARQDLRRPGTRRCSTCPPTPT